MHALVRVLEAVGDRLMRLPGAPLFTETIRRFFAREGSFRAAGLTYFSILAVVPVLCCMLVAAKTFGLDRLARGEINDRISELISDVESGQSNPLAQFIVVDAAEESRRRIAAEEFTEKARTLANELFERVDHMDVGTLGWIGLGVLVWTVVCMLSMVESSFNALWCVASPRALWHRCLVYVPLGILAPLLVVVVLSVPLLNLAHTIVAAASGSVWLPSSLASALLTVLDSKIVRFAVPGVISCLGFAFFFWIMPHARVNPRSALIGGAFTAVSLGVWLKICTLAQVGIVKMSALYGSFALVPILLGWTHVSWQIVLFGACLVRTLDRRAK